MSDPLKAVLVGCGGISGAWFNSLKAWKDVELVGLVDIREEAAKKRQQDYGLTNAKTGTDVSAMLKTTRPDVVFDCTVPDARFSVVTTALRHRCHVMTEKPMGASMDEARKMVKAAKKARRLFTVMQNRRYDPRIRAFAALLKSGTIGDLTTLHSDFFIGAHFGGFRDRMEHVLLLDMAIHSFDQARLISGADPVAVYCREWNPKGSWYDHDASAVVVFEMTRGIVLTYRGSWCAEGLNTSWECDWRAIGSRGSALWNGADAFRAQAVEKAEGFSSQMHDVTVTVDPDAKKGGHGGCIREFLDCVKAGKTPETVCTDNIKSLAMVFGAIQSAKTGRRVKIKI